MKSSAFDDIYNKTLKIIDIVDKVPSEHKNEVFKALFDIARTDKKCDTYLEEINKLTQNGNLLKDFIKNKKPQSNIERTTMFVFYLQKELKMTDICNELIEACYNASGLQLPGNLAQNVRDASSGRYRYIKSDRNGITLTEKGELFCRE